MPTRTVKHPARLDRHISGINVRQEGEGNEARNSYDITFSSEEPVQRRRGYWSDGERYNEVLSHDDGDVDLSRYEKDAMPLLRNHGSWNIDNAIGWIEDIRIEDGKGKATIRFDPDDEEAQKIERKVVNGTLRNISVGYDLTKASIDEVRGEENEISTYIYRNWAPTEISLVAVGADPSAGIGRSFEEVSEATVNITVREQETEMPQAQKPGDGGRSEETREEPNAPEVIVRSDDDVRKACTEDLDSWAGSSFFERFDAHKVAAEVRKDEPDPTKWVEEFRGRMDKAKKDEYDERDASTQVERVELGLSDDDKKRFSWRRALLGILASDSRANLSQKEIDDAGHELEVMREANKKLEKSGIRTVSSDFTIPDDILRQPLHLPRSAQRAVTASQTGTGLTNTGQNVIATELLVGSFIDALRHYVPLLERITTLDGLVGDVDIPKQTAKQKMSWNAETGGDLNQQNVGLDVVSGSPRNAGIAAGTTRRMLIQSTPGIDDIIRSDFIGSMAEGIHLAIIAGDGSGESPTGVMNAAGVTEIDSPTNGADLTWDLVVKLWSAVAGKNALRGNPAYVASAATIGLGMTKSKDAGSGRFIVEDGMIGAYPVLMANQMPTEDQGSESDALSLAFGNWEDVILGLWSGLDIMADPFTLAGKRQVRFFVYQDMDIMLRYPEAFARQTGIKKGD